MFMELRLIYFLQMFADFCDAEILRSDKYETKYCIKDYFVNEIVQLLTWVIYLNKYKYCYSSLEKVVSSFTAYFLLFSNTTISNVVITIEYNESK